MSGKPVHLLPTLSDPIIVMKATRRVGADAVDVDQPHCLYDYNRFMGGVDTFDQHRANYDVGRKGKKAWRYLFWFLLNAAIINAFVLYQATSRRQLRKRRYRHLDFRLELEEQLIGGFSGRKRKANRQPLRRQGPVAEENAGVHVSVHIGETRRRCVYHSKVMKERRDTVFGCEM